MVIAALVWLGYQFWRLLFQTGYWGAIDLMNLHREIPKWFSGLDSFLIRKAALYPPASYVMLFPLLGWLEETPARWLWAITTLAAIVWLIRLMSDAVKPKTNLERIFVGLLPLSAYAVGATIGNGQLGLHVLPALVAGTLLLRKRPDWPVDLLAAGLILASLVKPSISAPFFWIVLFAPHRLRPAALVAIGYAALTIFALSFRPEHPTDLFQALWVYGPEMSSGSGVSNVSLLLARLDLRSWIFPITLLILAGHGAWVWAHRDRDIWFLLGVTGIVARFWIYHGWYDDLLVLLPVITLIRIAKSGPPSDNRDVIAGALFGLTFIFSLAPGGLYFFPPPWNTIYEAAQVIVWLAVLIFLLFLAGHTEPNPSVMENTQ